MKADRLNRHSKGINSMSKSKKLNFVSRDPEIINSRFIVKASILSRDGNTSIMLVINDILDGNFKIQYFKKHEDVHSFLRLLHAIN